MVSQIFVQESKKAFYQTKALSNKKKDACFQQQGKYQKLYTD